MKEHLLLIEHFEDLNRIDLIINESFLVEYNSHTTLNIAEIEEIFKAAAKYVENGAVQDVIAGTKAQSKKVYDSIKNKISQHKTNKQDKAFLVDLKRISPDLKKKIVQDGLSGNLPTIVTKLENLVTADVTQAPMVYSLLKSVDAALEDGNVDYAKDALVQMAKDYLGESVVLKEGPASLFHTLKKNVRLNQKKASYEQILKYWEKSGSPRDSNSIISMLEELLGLSKNEIATIFQRAGKVERNADARYSNVVNRIKDSGIQKQAYDLADKILKDKESVFSESLNEMKIDNADIRKLFIELEPNSTESKEHLAKDKEKAHVVMGNYVKKWKIAFDKIQEKNQKMQMIKEIVNFLADRHGTAEWQNYSKFVQNLIKQEQTVGDKKGYDALKTSLGLINKIKDPDERNKQKSRVMSKMNSLRKSANSQDVQYNDFLNAAIASIAAGKLMESKLVVPGSGLGLKEFFTLLVESSNNINLGRFKK